METTDITWNHYYSLMEKISLVTGLWPFLRSRTKLFCVSLLTMVTLTVIVPQIAFQFTCKGNVLCVCLSLTSILLSVIILLKVYTFQLNTHKFKVLTEHLYVDWKKLETPEEYEIMKSYAENTKWFSIIYPAYVTIALIIFMCLSFIPFLLDVVLPLNESRPLLLPYPAYYFVDDREYFTYIFSHGMISWTIMMFGLFAHDCMFVSYVEHVCSMFAVVGYRFESLIYDPNALKGANPDPDEKYHGRIVFLVHMHQEVIKLAQLLESIFNIPFVGQLLISTLGISTTLLQITQETNILKITKYVLYVIGQLIHLFFLNFEGQRLLDCSIEVHDKIYNSYWYTVPRKLRKLLMLIMMKSNQPSTLTGGKIYTFSLENFSMVLQTSMSYFTVLASF